MSEASGRSASVGAEIRTLLPDAAPRDWTLSDTSAVPDLAPVSFAIQVRPSVAPLSCGQTLSWLLRRIKPSPWDNDSERRCS